MLNNNTGRALEFTQSARRHRIGKARILAVLAEPDTVVLTEGPAGQPPRLLVVGRDGSGRALEVVVVAEVDRFVVIHAMHLRPKYGRFLVGGSDEWS